MGPRHTYEIGRDTLGLVTDLLNRQIKVQGGPKDQG